MVTYKNKINTEEINQLPTFLYEGEVVIIDSHRKVLQAVDELSHSSRLGFDTETRPSFTKGVVHNVALLQLSTDERVYLFRLNKCGLPNPLKKILTSEEIQKIGVGLRDDLRGLRRLSRFTPGAFLDLQIFVKAFGIEEMAFSKLMSIIFNVRISKRQRTTNWEAPELTPAQIKYAATDAWGALKMYEALTTDIPVRLS